MKLYCVRVKTRSDFFIDSTWISEKLAIERCEQLKCAFAASNVTDQFAAEIFWQHLTGAKLQRAKVTAQAGGKDLQA